jgi:MFS family permease
MMLATLLAALDQTVVATALPQIVTDLHGFRDLSWVVSSFLVAATVTVPLYGKLSDLYGRRRMFVVAISIFLVGSALCGAAQSMGQLIAFRAIQGVGAGGLLPLSQAEIADLFSLVEVPESAADDVIAALRHTSIKGRRATVRRERYPAR